MSQKNDASDVVITQAHRQRGDDVAIADALGQIERVLNELLAHWPADCCATFRLTALAEYTRADRARDLAKS